MAGNYGAGSYDLQEQFQRLLEIITATKTDTKEAAPTGAASLKFQLFKYLDASVKQAVNPAP